MAHRHTALIGLLFILVLFLVRIGFAGGLIINPFAISSTGGGGGEGTLVSDTFDGTESPLATNWTTVPLTVSGSSFIGMRKTGGLAGGSSSATYSGSYRSAETFSDNQYSKVVLSETNQLGVMVRVSTSGAYFSYTRDTNRIYLWKVVGSTPTNLHPGGTYYTYTHTDGATLELRAEGSSLTILINGTAIATPVTDASLSSGSPGIYANWVTTYGIDSWEGGDL